MVIDMKYEVVCTKHYFDIGLLISEDIDSKPTRVLARHSTYSESGREYGGVQAVEWIRTGVFLSEKEWIEISCDKPTDRILVELGIAKKPYSESENKNKYSDYRRDEMIRASNYAEVDKQMLLNEFDRNGLMGVYNLGLIHMYDYMKSR